MEPVGRVYSAVNWDGQGDNVGVWRPSGFTFFQHRNDNTTTTAAFGVPTDLPVTGDWDPAVGQR